MDDAPASASTDEAVTRLLLIKTNGGVRAVDGEVIQRPIGVSHFFLPSSRWHGSVHKTNVPGNSVN